jgi:hypothetical protein
MAGLQHFNSYGTALIVTTVERLINALATIMIIGAVILYLIK